MEATAPISLIAGTFGDPNRLRPAPFAKPDIDYGLRQQPIELIV
jgi:hypothetical protein